MRIFMKQKNKQFVEKVLVGTFWIIVWQICAGLIDNSILFASPLDVAKSLVKNAGEMRFYQIVLVSLRNIGMGFLLAFFGGVILGSVCYKVNFLGKLFSPLIQVLKAIPVASFVVILLILTGTDYLSVFVSFLVVFPGIYENTVLGLKSADLKLLELAEIYDMPGYLRYFHVYRKAVVPYLIGYCKSAIGMSLKSGVAAEVIGTPDFTIGERMYMAKVHLETADIFAWTLVVILCSYVMEKAFIGLLSWYDGKDKPLFHPRKEKPQTKENIKAEYISKKYGDTKVIDNFSQTFEKGKCYVITGSSGTGKTTLMRILAGLTVADSGEVTGVRYCRKAMVFQENRLFPGVTAVENVCSTTGKSSEECEKELQELLEKEDFYKKTEELSGGMQRRVEICRAMIADADVVYLDEPFAGLDEETRVRTVSFIKKKAEGKLLIVNTHRTEDAEELGGELISTEKV